MPDRARLRRVKRQEFFHNSFFLPLGVLLEKQQMPLFWPDGEG